VKIVVLDSLFDSLDVETEAASSVGATVERWNGDPVTLATAEAVVHVRTPVDAELIAALTTCRVIARFGTGLDTVDVQAAEAAGMAVLGVRDYCLPELCSQTLGIAFALLRRLRETEGNLDLTWDKIARQAPLERGEQVAVVGLGSVGRRIAAALIALGYRVTAVTDHARDEAERLGAAIASLEEALAVAELVFLHPALTERTRGLIDARRLALMRPGAILINTARLGLINEAAVAQALDTGTLGGLGLDASLPLESPLRRFARDERVLITPHIGWYSETSAASLRRNAIVDAVELARQSANLEVSKR
jgi:D-3-phosphoglycerate dehydrogenase